jgi:hypothetical protein
MPGRGEALIQHWLASHYFAAVSRASSARHSPSEPKTLSTDEAGSNEQPPTKEEQQFGQNAEDPVGAGADTADEHAHAGEADRSAVSESNAGAEASIVDGSQAAVETVYQAATERAAAPADVSQVAAERTAADGPQAVAEETKAGVESSVADGSQAAEMVPADVPQAAAEGTAADVLQAAADEAKTEVEAPVADGSQAAVEKVAANMLRAAAEGAAADKSRATADEEACSSTVDIPVASFGRRVDGKLLLLSVYSAEGGQLRLRGFEPASSQRTKPLVVGEAQWAELGFGPLNELSPEEQQALCGAICNRRLGLDEEGATMRFIDPAADRLAFLRSAALSSTGPPPITSRGKKLGGKFVLISVRLHGINQLRVHGFQPRSGKQMPALVVCESDWAHMGFAGLATLSSTEVVRMCDAICDVLELDTDGEALRFGEVSCNASLCSSFPPALCFVGVRRIVVCVGVCVCELILLSPLVRLTPGGEYGGGRWKRRRWRQ